MSQNSHDAPHQKWTHLASPTEFDKLPHLHSVATEWVDSPSYSWEFHPLDAHCEFKYTLEGCGCALYEGRTYKLDRGKALIFSKRVPGTRFYYPPNGTKRWRFLECEIKNTHEIIQQLDSRHGPVYELGDDHFIVKELLALSGEQRWRDKMISMTENFRICCDILSEMCRIIELKDSGADGSIALRARNLIYEQRMRDFSLPDLAKSLGVSQGHLCREFRNQLNDTPKHYHNELRMKLMEEQVINTDKPFKEIAAEFGFLSTSSFNAFFKKHSGTTPGLTRHDARRHRGGRKA